VRFRIFKPVMLPEPSHPIATCASHVWSRQAIDKLVIAKRSQIALSD